MKQGGYIALMSAIIISVILLGLTFTLSFRGFFGRFNILDSEFKERSLGLAEACAERALLRLATIPKYAGNETLTIDGESCQIYPVKSNFPAINQYTIETKAVLGQTVSNIRIVAATSSFSIISWEEIPTLP